jgi:hypothetical protein
MERRTVQVPASRLQRWIDGFAQRHAGMRQEIREGALHLTGGDGGTAQITPGFPIQAATPEAFITDAQHLPRTGVVLIRRGGFAAAVAEDGAIVASDIGRRHVQGRTAAGGWSQQRFARRRDKQVHELVDAAVTYVARILLPALPLDYLATGGDRPLLDELLADPRLRALADIPRGPHLDVPDPRRDVINSLPERLSTLRIDIIDP